MSACSITLRVDASSAYVVNEILVIPDAGVSFNSNCFKKIYTAEDPVGLHMLSEHKRLCLSFLVNEEQVSEKFNYFSKVFSLELMPPGFQIEKPEPPQLCSCCVGAAKYRVKDWSKNPVTSILDHAGSILCPLVVSLENEDGRVIISHTPIDLWCQSGHLVSEGQNNQLKISIAHLHAMRLSEVVLEGRSHVSLALYNSRGDLTCTISAEKDYVSNTWQMILDDRNHCYQILEV